MILNILESFFIKDLPSWAFFYRDPTQKAIKVHRSNSGLAGKRLDDGPACGQRRTGRSPSKSQVAGMVFDDFLIGILI